MDAPLPSPLSSEIMICPICRAEAPGAYCPACGAPVEGARCRSCDAALLPGANFCIHCGTATREGAPSWRAPWLVAVVAVVALFIALLASGQPADRSSAPNTRPSGSGTFDLGARRPPELTGTPREQADRLFNRVMQALSQNDTEQASFFLPMAILAYQQAGELDDDGLYHLSLLQAASGDASTARATAERILEREPDHVLALGAAARAADQAGDTEAARRYYRHLVRVYQAELERGRTEYEVHADILPTYRAEATEYLGR